MIKLESFKVHRKLSFYNLQVEPKKVKITYSVEKHSGEIDYFQLLYTYEHPCFSKKNPADVNLASMMLAQVALNYGLFFEEIEFDGLYDKTDQQFLKSMMENTSIEILTNKILVKNEFLKSPYDTLAPEKRD